MLPIPVLLGVGQMLLSGWMQNRQQKLQEEREQSRLNLDAAKLAAAEQKDLREYHRGGWLMPTMTLIILLSIFVWPLVIPFLSALWDLQIGVVQMYRSIDLRGFWMEEHEVVHLVRTVNDVQIGDLHYSAGMMMLGHHFGVTAARTARVVGPKIMSRLGGVLAGAAGLLRRRGPEPSSPDTSGAPKPGGTSGSSGG